MEIAYRKHLSLACLLLVALVIPRSELIAQQTESERAEIQELRSELKRIEARIDALESKQATATVPSNQSNPGSTATLPAQAGLPSSTASRDTYDAAASQAPTSTGSPKAEEPSAVKDAQDTGMDTMDAGMGGQTISIPYVPELKIRGFGDVRAFVADQNLGVINSNPGEPIPSTQAGRSTFALGLMDLFVTSKITDRFSYLAEIGFEADPSTNDMGVDLERAQISFTPNDSFSVSAGRTHAMLGYYNTAFHHGTWFQTTIDRPRIFEFEDSGGPLPIHNVGLAAMGKIPSGSLGLHWLAEVGNGKQSYSLAATATPANVLADHTGKSTNLGFFVRPDKLNGFQTGFNWYQASLVPVVSSLPGYGTPEFAFPNAASNYRQNIFVSHIIYTPPRFEFMVEDVEIRDVAKGSNRPLYTSGGYAQVSRSFGSSRPYVRYQWLNPNFSDPNNAWVGRWVGPTVGYRRDLNTFVALKLEFSHFDWKSFSTNSSADQVLPILHKTVNQLGSQLTYTF